MAATVATFGIVALLGLLGLGAMLGLMRVRTGNTLPLDSSLLIRYNSYCSASRMILERPALGYGPGAYEIENAPFWTPYEQNWFARRLKLNAHVHNDTLEIAIDAGLPAAGVYLAILVTGIGAGVLMGFAGRDARQRRLGLMAAAFFTAFFVDGCLGFNLRVPVSAALLFLMAGVVEGLWGQSQRAQGRAALSVRAYAWRVAAAALVLTCVVVDSRVFASEACLNLGKRQMHRKNNAAAKALFARGERLAPWNWQFSRQQGLAALAERDFSSAAAHFARSLERNPHYVVTLVAMARAQMGIGVAEMGGPEEGRAAGPAASPALDEAAAYAARALELCPEFARGEEVLGRVASMRAVQLAQEAGASPAEADIVREAWRDAAGHLSRAILLDAENLGELYRLLARVLVGLEDEDDAEEALVRSVQTDPADEESWGYFYQFAQDSGYFDRLCGALELELDRVRRTKDLDADALAGILLWLGRVYHVGYNDVDAAEACFREAVQRGPSRFDAWRMYGRFARHTDRNEGFMKAAASACEALETQGERPLRPVQAVALVQRRGAEALDEATKLLLTEVDAQGRAGRVRLMADELGWAGDLLLDVAREAPAELQGPAYLELGVFYANIGEHARADRLYPAAMPNLSPEDQSICVQRWAQTLMGLKRPVEAINLLRQSLQDDPEDPGLRLSLARIYARAGMRDLARDEYKRLLEMDLDGASRGVVKEELRLVSGGE